MSLFGVRKKQTKSLSRSVNMRHTKDFDWRPTKNNPLKKKEVEKKETRRVTVLIIICVSSLLITVAILLFHKAFRITNITIEGVKRVDSTDMESVVYGILEGNGWFFVPQNNYFIVNMDDIESILLQRYPIHSVDLKKHFPNKLSLLVHEKQATFLYDNGLQYSYIDEDGIVVDVLKNIPSGEWREQKRVVYTNVLSENNTNTTSTITSAGLPTEELVTVSKIHIPDALSLQSEFGDFPVIYDVRGLETKKDSQTVDKDVLESVILYYKELQNRTIKPLFVEVDETGQFGQIKMGEGWSLLVSFDPKLAVSQMVIFDQVVSEHLKDRASAVSSYIDIRYAGRAYWK